MELQILTGMIFDLIEKGSATAAFFAEKYGVSNRTVYRYVEYMQPHLPVRIKRGRSGGIHLSENYKLPAGLLSKDEYGATVEALYRCYLLTGEERFIRARHKISMQCKSQTRDMALSGDVGSYLVDCGDWGMTRSLRDTLFFVETCIKERMVIEIGYKENGDEQFYKIEPHVLAHRKHIWYLFAFCHARRTWALFTLGNITHMLKTDELFQKRPFLRARIPLDFNARLEKCVSARLEIPPDALDEIRAKVGDMHLKNVNGKWLIDAVWEDSDELPYTLLALGKRVRILSPQSLCERVKAAAQELANAY